MNTLETFKKHGVLILDPPPTENDTNMKEYLENIKKLILEADKETLKMSGDNCRAPGLFELTISKHTSIFMARQDIRPYQIQLTENIANVRLTTIQGTVRHHTATSHPSSRNSETIGMCKYRRTLMTTKFDQNVRLKIRDHYLPVLSTVELHFEEIRTISCDRVSAWIEDRSSKQREYSYLYGHPEEKNVLYKQPSKEYLKERKSNAISIIDNLIEKLSTVE